MLAQTDEGASEKIGSVRFEIAVAGFADSPNVINGASDVLVEIFEDAS